MNIIALQKHYQEKCVLDLQRLTLQSSFAHGLLGANGAGKSTLIKILMGLVYADGKPDVALESVSMLPENPYLPIHLSAYQIVSHACSVQGASQAVESLLEEVCLKPEAWHQPIRTYSKGMKQRTAIAYALAGQPEWLILDEPMSGLDAMGRKHMLDVFMRRKQAGTSILMCSHAVTDLVRLCDQVHIMAQGKMCETMDIKAHNMQEVEDLEQRLIHWSHEHALD
ncbi:ATP-binding cassette domain-containing protein [Ghiorsea bivora]|uniref:ATP-binding cassette domain-containing protein n=1 Tax=Ghiorsea bivora TaxID=1485545 RepID=UPI000689F180|nr:ABC transporter ATP-binding protein [Ghiorsea bivora]